MPLADTACRDTGGGFGHASAAPPSQNLRAIENARLAAVDGTFLRLQFF
jgi:hypothetical protein